MEFKQALANGQNPAGKLKFEGKIKLIAKTNTTLAALSKLKANLLLSVQGPSGNVVTVTKARGKFNTNVTNEAFDFEVRNELPDYLNADSIILNPKNVTLRLDADMTSLPISIKLHNANLTAFFNNAETKNVQMPTTPVFLEKGTTNMLYFFQGDKPYDTQTIAPKATLSNVENLGTLLNNIPNRLRLDFGQGAATLKDEVATIDFTNPYEANVAYKLFVPFTFEKGFQLYYEDYSDEIDWDMEDWTAEHLNAEINGVGLSTIPLDIVLSVEALDKDGKVLPIKFSPVTLQSATNEPKKPL